MRPGRLTRAGLAAVALLIGACDGCGRDEVVVDAIDPVAECVATSGDVRRRLSLGTAWNSLASGTPLFSGDWVQTAQRAHAEVVFTDGSDLFVEPSTTVVIEAPDEQGDEAGIRRIAVRSGSVRAGLPRGRRQRVEVRLPAGQTIALAPRDEAAEADVRIAVDEAGEAEVAVTRGAVALEAGGETVDLESGSSLRVAEGQASPPEPLPAAPELDPLRAGDPAYVGAPVGIRWSVPEPDRTFRVELSRVDGPGRFEQVIEANAPPVEWEPPAPAIWVARVFAVGADGRRSPPSNPERIEVVVDERLRLLRRPVDGGTFRVTSGRARVELVWEAHPDGGPYQVTVGSGDALEPAVVRTEVEGPSHPIRLGPGLYTWGVHRGDEPLFVEPFRFRVLRRGSDLEVPSRLDWR